MLAGLGDGDMMGSIVDGTREEDNRVWQVYRSPDVTEESRAVFLELLSISNQGGKKSVS